MAKALHRSTGIVLLLTIISIILYNRTSQGLFLTLAITFGTTAYHFLMRLLVGWLFENIMHNHADYTRKWYQLRPWERKFYAFCKVKKWKNKMPTYHPERFSPDRYTWEEIAQMMCQSELGHETIAILSFLPIVSAKWFGALPVFVITSICAVVFDLLFVMMQRYNSDRVVRMMKKNEKR